MRNARSGWRRARAFVVRALLFALLLPTAFSVTSPDPRWLLGVDVQAQRASHGHPEGTPRHDHSAIPGSPGHPADHDCAPCQTLKYLALCLPQPKLALPVVVPAVFPPLARNQAQRTGHFAALPPSRAPPTHAA
jgi:hypothetical protein